MAERAKRHPPLQRRVDPRWTQDDLLRAAHFLIQQDHGSDAYGLLGAARPDSENSWDDVESFISTLAAVAEAAQPGSIFAGIQFTQEYAEWRTRYDEATVKQWHSAEARRLADIPPPAGVEIDPEASTRLQESQALTVDPLILWPHEKHELLADRRADLEDSNPELAARISFFRTPLSSRRSCR